MTLIPPILLLWSVSVIVLFIFLLAELSRGRRIDVSGLQRRKRKPTFLRIQDSEESKRTVDQNNVKEEVDCIIVGAGVVGAALACTLAKDGRKIKVFERDLGEQDRIVGELLQPGGYMKLLELGLGDCVEGIDAQSVLGYALFKNEDHLKITYPLKRYSNANISGRGFHNGRFIQKMRLKAASHPLIDLEQGNVVSLIESEGIVRGVRYKSVPAGGEEKSFYAPLTFVCDGSFSNLRSRVVSTPNLKVKTPSWFVGLIIENPQSLPFPNHGHVIFAEPSPILFYPISSAEVRCLVDVPGEKILSGTNGRIANYLSNVVACQLPLELRKPFLDAIQKSKIRSMPNKCMPAVSVAKPGAVVLGDALNMRHPLTGGGMTVAMTDILIMRDMLRPLEDFTDATALHRYLQDFYVQRKPMSATINILADSLYKVFTASDSVEEQRRQACFDYLSLGGMFASGPMALLGGLNPSIGTLIFHFLLLTAYGLVRVLLPFPTPSRQWVAARLIWKAPGLIFPSMINEGLLPYSLKLMFGSNRKSARNLSRGNKKLIIISTMLIVLLVISINLLPCVLG